jgi:beta-glucosidase
MGWGSGTTEFPYLIDPLSAITSHLNTSGVTITSVLNEFNTTQVTNAAKNKSVCLVFSNADSGEGYITVDGNAGDRKNLTLWNSGEALITTTANNCNNTVVVLHTVGPVIVESWINHPNVKAVLFAGLPGQESGNALVDVLFGAVNPSGKLPYTVAKATGDYPAQVSNSSSSSTPEITYSEGVNIDYKWVPI